MTIAFRLDANHQIGMGHASRCATLAAELAALGCGCTFFCRENPSARALLESRGFEVRTVPELDPALELTWIKTALTGFDAAILDSYFLSDSYIDGLNRPGLPVCCIDDNALYTYSCDLILNGNLHAPELPYRFGRKHPQLLLGGQYCLLRKPFRDAQPVTLRKDANRAFVCMGGSDLRNFTTRTVSALQEIPGVALEVVLGPMTKCDDELHRISGENVTIHKSPDNLPEIMNRCDIAVTAAGSMAYELAALGLPTILTVQADNQEQIAQYMSRHKLMTVAGDYTMTDLSPLRRECESLLSDFDRRRRESAALRAAVAKDGASKAAKYISHAFGSA